MYTGESKAELLEVMEGALKKENERHELLPRSAFGLPDAFHTVKVMREASVIIVVMNTNGKSERLRSVMQMKARIRDRGRI